MNSTTFNLAAQSRLFAFSLRGNKALKEDFERAAIPHLSYVYTAAFYLTKDKQDAEDLVQETYLRAYRFFHKFQPGTNCRAWLLSIERHLFINHYQKQKKQPRFVNWEKIDQDYESLVFGEEHSEKRDPEALLCAQDMGVEVERALRDLPEDFRTAIVLVDIDELNYEEAAQVLHCPVGTVRSRLSRARRMLQVALREYAIENGIRKK